MCMCNVYIPSSFISALKSLVCMSTRIKHTIFFHLGKKLRVFLGQQKCSFKSFTEGALQPQLDFVNDFPTTSCSIMFHSGWIGRSSLLEYNLENFQQTVGFFDLFQFPSIVSIWIHIWFTFVLGEEAQFDFPQKDWFPIL